MNIQSPSSKSLNTNKALIFLSLASIIMRVFGYSRIFLKWVETGNLFDYSYFTEGYWTIGFPGFKDFLNCTLDLAIKIAPCVLFLLYLTKFKPNPKSTKLVVAFLGIKSVTGFIIYFLEIIFYPDYVIRFDYISELIYLVAWGIVVYAALKGFAKKSLAIIPMTLILADSVFYFVTDILPYLKSYILYFQLTYWADFLSSALFTVALIIFCLKKIIIPIIPEKITKTVSNDELLLIQLKKDFETGIITEEEYQQQRNSIISKL